MSERGSRGQGRVYLRKGKWWQISFRRDGKEYRESAAAILRMPWQDVTERDARRALDERLKAVYSGRFVEPEHRRLTVKACLDALLTNLELRGAKALPTLRSTAARLTATVGTWRASECSTPRVERLAAQWLDEGLKPATVKGRLSFLCQALRLAVDHQRLASAPRLPAIRVDNARRGFLSPEQFAALLACLPGVDAEVIEWLWHSAWRPSEACGLRWEDVDRAACSVTLATTKNGERRTLPLEGRLSALIEARWRARQLGCPLVFHRAGRRVRIDTLLDVFKRHAAAAGHPELVVYDLRRSAVRNMVRAGVHQHVAMTISGHRSATVFRRYDIVSSADVADGLRQTQRFLETER